MIAAEPVIALVHPVVAFVAVTVYVPAALMRPKSRDPPVPGRGAPTVDAPSIS
jgi:hypothetical protein